jgi:hypothetical protein
MLMVNERRIIHHVLFVLEEVNMFHLKILTAIFLALCFSNVMADEDIGKLSENPYNPDSTSNPYGEYGSEYSPDSVNNPYGRYGSRFSNENP